jgi:hypothetical protein
LIKHVNQLSRLITVIDCRDHAIIIAINQLACLCDRTNIAVIELVDLLYDGYHNQLVGCLFL